MQKVIGGILILSATAGAGVVYGNELKDIYGTWFICDMYLD